MRVRCPEIGCEIRNLLIDSAFGGFWAAMMAFNALLAAIGIGLSVALFKRKETRPAESTDTPQSRNEHLEGAV